MEQEALQWERALELLAEMRDVVGEIQLWIALVEYQRVTTPRNPIKMVWKRNLPSSMGSFGVHVSFRGCICVFQML